MAKCSYKSCNNPTWSKGRCKFHPLEKPKPMKRTKLAPMSKKEAKRQREYSVVNKEFKEENPTCCIPGCNKLSTTHHSRGRTGKDLTDVSTFRALCVEHHRYYETHPEEARAMGLTQSRISPYLRDLVTSMDLKAETGMVIMRRGITPGRSYE